MDEFQIQHPFSLPPPPLPPLPRSTSTWDDAAPPPSPSPSPSRDEPPRPPPPPFDPSRRVAGDYTTLAGQLDECFRVKQEIGLVIGIIRRKALVKDLAALYHAECLTYCQELLELQKKTDEPFTDVKGPEEPKKETLRPSKRQKKTR